MGLFSGIRNTYKKSEAAVIVQNLLEHQQNAGFFDSDPGPTATKLVGDLWDQKPDIFNGKFGQRPHKLTVAAAALANSLNLNWSSDSSRNAILLALGTILSEIETNGILYPFNGIDERLIAMAANTFTEEADSQPKLDVEIGGISKAIPTTKQPASSKPTTKKEAGAFIDAQLAEGAMTKEQFDVICKVLSLGAMMTGNLTEAYEMGQGKPVDSEKFAAWLSDHPEGQRWHAVWLMIRDGKPDTEYRAV